MAGGRGPGAKGRGPGAKGRGRGLRGQGPGAKGRGQGSGQGPGAGGRVRTPSNRTEVFDNKKVKGSEFLRKVKAVARRKKLAYRWVPERGSGSHGTLYFGDRLTVVKDLKKELGPGLLCDMCK